ncbi:hypothetical protein AcV7_002150 [Taiwanofungus camphoratus]|nr:hypothetical protein AcV7_002150 [Antrodia cinnamomea]
MGAQFGVPDCLYRIGMAHLKGQLGLPVSPEAALPYLKRAASLATLDVPEPAYVYGLLLLNDFSPVSIPSHLFEPHIPPGSSAQNEARNQLEHAAYLHCAPAQLYTGRACELADSYAEKASRKGLPNAEFAMGYYAEVGVGGAKDIDAARA